MQKFLSFTEPEEALEYFTSTDVIYEDLKSNAQILEEKIPCRHVNQDDKEYRAITQCILECIKRIKGFYSNVWVSESKLTFKLRENELPISFSRVVSDNEIVKYNIINFDQIDFESPLEFDDIIKDNSLEEKKLLHNIKSKPILTQDEGDFKKVLTLLQNGENVFLTGYAGTGKSYILNKLKEKLKKRLTITSTTGIAAVNIKGQTLHSWAGVGLCKNPVHTTVEKIKQRVSVLKQILNCKILAIDEISMLNLETFEYVDEVLKAVRGSTEVFGGIQLLLIGDFFQLPPVEIDKGTERNYCFESYLWKNLNLKNVILKENYRQSEAKFIKALSDMRINDLTKEDIKLLETRETNLDTYETDILHIFSTNEEANRYNLRKFNMIDEPVRIFNSTDAVYRGNKPVYSEFTDNEKYTLEIFGRNCRADKEIPLKLGARVMLLTNMDFNKGLINGSCGIINEFGEDTITVKFDNGILFPVPRHTFEYYYHDKIAATRTQYPLRLAYGITIHKSQGMTLDKLVVDCSRIFERGQAYVAMSRVKTLEGLYLKSFTPDKVMVDSKVAEFYENLDEVENVVPNNIPLFELNGDEELPLISDEEAKKIIYNCVKEFNGLYGKSGICKILSGSSTIKDDEYNTKARNSEFYSALKGRRQKDITALIDELILNKTIKITHYNAIRPMLIINSEI